MYAQKSRPVGRHDRLYPDEQTAEGGRLPVHDHQLASDLGRALSLVGVAVADIQALHMEAFEHPADIWMVIDADHYLPLAAAHEVGHPLVLFEQEVHAVALGLPVRRVHVMKGVRAIVALNALKPRQILNIGSRQPLPCS